MSVRTLDHARLLLGLLLWPQITAAHGQEILLPLFGGILGAAALFGFFGGVICGSRGIRAPRGFAVAHGL